MRAESIVRQVLHDAEDQIHRARLRAIVAAVLALIHGGRIGVAALGRAVAAGSFKHGIKRIDRLVGNGALADELEVFYAAITRYVVGSLPRPVILVDWTEAGTNMYALTAAVPMKGRAITIYSVTVPRSQYTARTIENAFLATLQKLLGPGCTPILVGDAGFRVPWMRQVKAMGWDFVTRIRGRTHVQRAGETTWQRWTQLLGKPSRSPLALGAFQCTRPKGGVDVQLVLFDPRRRSAPIGPRNARAMRATRASREPWMLATSLTLPPTQIVALYAARMQIELTFRDLKSHRFGWGFEDARSRSTTRIAVQIMLAAIASLVVLLVGLAAEAAGLRKQFQANTIVNRRVLSLMTLGCAVVRTAVEARLRVPDLRAHLPFVGIP